METDTKKIKFRNLTKEEIKVRVGSINGNYVNLFIYTDPRTIMSILDEGVGPMNWKCSHKTINGKIYCNIEIWDEDKKEWISKDDVGDGNNDDDSKGESSDSLKRAAIVWGIGRELYIPNISAYANRVEVVESNGKKKCTDSFYVDNVKIENKKIKAISIKSVKKKQVACVYDFTGDFPVKKL